jgi:hypothetical protein
MARPPIRTLVLACMGHAVPKWIFGRPTRFRLPTLLTLAQLQSRLGVPVPIVALARDTPRSVMLMDAISTPIAWEIPHSMVLA